MKLNTNNCKSLQLSLIIILGSFLTHIELLSQNIEIGKPFTKTYSHKEYNSSRINWSIAQDSRGVLYVGNENGILEFDGNTWRKIEVPNSELVRSVSISDDGTIFLCASNDFGYLETTSKGLLKYKSLLPFLDKKYHNFGEMWDVATSTHGVYFKNSDKIFRWNGNDIKVWDSVYAFRLYNINDTIYSRNQDTGLMMVDGDSIKLMPNGEFFADIGVYDMLPFNKKGEKEKILITTNNDGLFLHDGNKFKSFKTEVDDFVAANQIYNACITSDNKIAISTQRGGVVVINNYGNLEYKINKQSGLPTDVVYDLWPHKSGGLWLATGNGVVYVEIPTSFSILDKNILQEDQSNSVIRFNGKLYVTNSIGIFYFSEKTSSFKLVKGSDREASTFLIVDGTLLANTNHGIAIIENNRIVDFIDENAISLYKSKIFKGRIYVGTYDGFTIIQKEKNNKFSTKYSKELFNAVTGFVEDADGGLWIEGLFRGIYHVTGNLQEIETASDENFKYEYLTIKDGLPELNYGLYNIQDYVFLSTEKGMFKFSDDLNSFVRDSTFGNIFYDSTITISLVENSIENGLWVIRDSSGQQDFGKATLQNNGKYSWRAIPEFRRLDINSIISVYPEINSKSGNEIIWIISQESLILYNPNSAKTLESKFNALIRKVNVNKDSLVYGGAPRLGKLNQRYEFSYNKNNIGFEFTATSYEKPEGNQYKYILKGNDNKWSEWSSETKKEYTNLSAGEYSFQLIAKNSYGKISDQTVINFRVLSPWYYTWWAYSIYALIFGIGVFIVDRIQRRRLFKKAKERMKIQNAEHRAETAELQAKAAESQSRVIQAENDRKSKELEEARELQLSMLPKDLPKVENLDIAVYMKTATEVGGDYYDFSFKQNGSLNICLGDATGHGMKAGTLVSMIKSLFIANSIDKTISEYFSSTNEALKKSKLDKMMMAFAMLNIKENKIMIANAGIPPVYIFRKEKAGIEEVKVNGLPLGAMKNAKYEIFESELSKGDVILMLSDGFPELQNEKNEMYGYDRVIRSFEKLANENSENIINYLKEEGSKWVNGNEPDDDVTFVVIKIK